ncbi:MULTISPECIES: Gfo/Idh/MocA family protein [unclassified Microbacterium]|uniref:Gfo/Idh/MocA family protein n=1 Tax=unclassified Microbacterium TaxID=2609290 RepID=UPI0007124020|nr:MULTISPECIES: Gfo/Idh/MocA family oxidoreductase [unclassified Microbacterium]KQZ02907.1 oxidoreductase [Microbacterium sp. Root53]
MTARVHTASTDPIRTGIVGGGFMARVHAHAARAAGGQVVGITSSSPGSARAAADRLDVPVAHDDLAGLLDQGLDVVHICTPNSTHARYAQEVLDAGVNVVCEKPLATDASSARRLAATAEASGLVATVPFVYRFHPMAREARAMVGAGRLGELLTLQGGYLQDWLLDAGADNWRVDETEGGRSRAFGDVGSHLCDLMEFVSGERIVALQARTRIAHSTRSGREVRTEDLAVVIFETAGGGLGTLTVSQVAPGRKNRLWLEINGTQRTLAFDQEQPESLWVGEREGGRVLLRDPDVLSPDAARLAVVPAGHPQGYQDAFNGFVADTYAALRGEQRDGLPTFQDGLRATEVTEAVLLSARTSEWIRLHTESPTTRGHPLI